MVLVAQRLPVQVVALLLLALWLKQRVAEGEQGAVRRLVLLPQEHPVGPEVIQNAGLDLCGVAEEVLEQDRQIKR